VKLPKGSWGVECKETELRSEAVAPCSSAPGGSVKDIVVTRRVFIDTTGNTTMSHDEASSQLEE